MDATTFLQLAIAVGLGLLAGVQRDWDAQHVAGIRSFTLITLLGTALSLQCSSASDWLVVAGLIGVALITLLGLSLRLYVRQEFGLTTAYAVLAMYGAGVALGQDQTELGVIIGGTVVVLLQLKKPLHAFVAKLGAADMRSIIQLTMIGLVVLPVLPDQSYGPYAVLNPFKIWMIVVLIVGISLGSYIAYRFFDVKTGTLLGGILGGMMSSTATTVSYARQTKEQPDYSPLAAMVIMIASTIVFGRVLFEITVVAPEILPQILPPILAMTLLMGALAAGQFLLRGVEHATPPMAEKPAGLRAAIVFGALYACVLVAVAAAKHHFGNRGLYVVAALSGLTDMDAITLSSAEMVRTDNLPIDTAWRMIVIGALSNIVFKGAIIGFLGHPRLFRRMLLLFGLALIGGILLLVFWPAV